MKKTRTGAIFAQACHNVARKVAVVVPAVVATPLVILLLPTISCFVSCPRALAQSSTTINGGVSTHFLQGGIEHAERMAPVQKALQVGITYDESRLEKQAPTRFWYRVPPWLAGTWQFDQQTQTSYLDCKTGVPDQSLYQLEAHLTETWGCQRDRLGGYWDYINVPFTTEVTSDKERDKDMHTEDSVIFDSDARVIMRYVYTRTALDKKNTITGVFQMEQFTTIVPCGPGLVRSEMSMKKFDDRGNPIYLEKAWRIGKKTAPLKVDGRDPSFRQYLRNNGLNDLVPVD